MYFIYETRPEAPSMSLAKTESDCFPLSQRGSLSYNHVNSTLAVLLSELRVPTLPGTLLSGAERHMKMGHTSIHRTHMETACRGNCLKRQFHVKWPCEWFCTQRLQRWNMQKCKHAKMAYIPKVLHRLCSHYSPFEIHLQSIFIPIALI